MTATAALADAVAGLREVVIRADAIVPVGGRTQWEVGGPAPSGVEISAPAGVLEYDPAELTVTVAAGTTVAELTSVLAAAGQQCPLDPRDPHATVGGVLACGLSGPRRLRYGPIRNRLLEVWVMLADGRHVKGGGRVVKNVTGYDIPRLLVGSLGTLGLITQVTLRCEPLPRARAWLEPRLPPDEVWRRAFRPSAIVWDGSVTRVLCEGEAADLDEEATRLDDAPFADAPPWPEGAHAGRCSVRPSAVLDVAEQLARLPGCRWLAELGVGTIHVATDDEAMLAEARRAAQRAGGWMLREAGAPGLDGFGVELPGAAVMARIKAALDPDGRCNPGRLPIPSP